MSTAVQTLTINVLTPNGGEIFQPGQQVQIQWQSSGAVSHSVKLSTDGGNNFTDISPQLPGSARSFVWTVPQVATDRARIRVAVRDANDNRVMDDSEANFRIAVPPAGSQVAKGDSAPFNLQRQPGAQTQVAVLFPNGGEEIEQSQPVEIRWQSVSGTALVRHDVLLSTDGGQTFSFVASGLAGSARSFTWTPPTTLETENALIQVVARDAAGVQASDRSNNVFSISQPSLTGPFNGQLPGNPIAVVFARVVPPGDSAFVYLTNARPGIDPNTKDALVVVSADGKTLIASLNLGTNQPPNFLLDVMDIDGDGVAEIVALFPGQTTAPMATPVLYVYKLKFKNNKLKIKTILRTEFPLGTGLGAGSVKVYPVAGGATIVAAPETFSGDFGKNNSTANVIFINGRTLSQTPISVPVTHTNDPNGREILTFPAVMVGERFVAVISKSRLLVFDKNNPASNKFYQFVDDRLKIGNDNVTFTNYDANQDTLVPGAGSDPSTPKFQGRRYGQYRLVERNNRTELIVTADGNIDSTEGVNLAGAVYEMLPVSLTPADPQRASYVRPFNRVGLRRSTIGHTFRRGPNGKPIDNPPVPVIPLPSNYQGGVSLGGVTLIGDKWLVVTTEFPEDSKPKVRLIDFDNQTAVDPNIPGLCNNVGAGPSRGFSDLLVYNPGTRKHTLWRVSLGGGTLQATRLGDLPDEVAAAFLILNTPNGVKADLAYGQNTDHISVQLALSDASILTAVANSSNSFLQNNTRMELSPAPPVGLRSWTLLQGVPRLSLDMPTSRPGRVVNILPVNNRAVWVLELEGNPRFRVGLFTQNQAVLEPFLSQGQPPPKAKEGKENFENADFGFAPRFPPRDVQSFSPDFEPEAEERRTFIRPDERPSVGARALNKDEGEGA